MCYTLLPQAFRNLRAKGARIEPKKTKKAHWFNYITLQRLESCNVNWLLIHKRNYTIFSPLSNFKTLTQNWRKIYSQASSPWMQSSVPSLYKLCFLPTLHYRLPKNTLQLIPLSSINAWEQVKETVVTIFTFLFALQIWTFNLLVWQL